jgi:hypothetical protein
LSGVAAVDSGKTVQFQLAALYRGRNCYCGVEYGKNIASYSFPPAAGPCDMPCRYDHNQMCGGETSLSVYKTSGWRESSE